MIAIIDKVSLRQVAVDMALRRYHDDSRDTGAIIELADKLATYIQGGANLPEFDNESMAPVNIGFTTINPYNSEDSDDD